MNALRSLRCQVVGHDHQRRHASQHLTQITCSVCHEVHVTLSPQPRIYRIYDQAQPIPRRPPARVYGLQARLTGPA